MIGIVDRLPADLGRPAAAPRHAVSIAGSDPILPTRFRVGEAAAVDRDGHRLGATAEARADRAHVRDAAALGIAAGAPGQSFRDLDVIASHARAREESVDSCRAGDSRIHSSARAPAETLPPHA
jgi:hypothetical protein